MSASSPRRDDPSTRPGGEGGLSIAGQTFLLSKRLRKYNCGQSWLGTDETGERLIVANGIEHSRLTAGARLRLEHEGHVLVSTRHPHLVPLIAAGTVEQDYWLVSEYVAGTSVHDRIRQREPLPVLEAIALARGVFAALAELHEHGVLHSGIDPRNVLLGDEQRTGLLVWSGPLNALQADQASPQDVLEIARYSSPERNQVLSDEVGEASDVYAAAAVIYLSLTGRPPYEATNLNELLWLQTTRAVPRLGNSGPAVPPALDDLLQRALARDPAARYQSASAVLHDLELIRSVVEEGRADVNVVVGTRDARRSLAPPAFVSREGELSLLNEQIDAARAGMGGIAVVEGHSGLGKSRLIEEFEFRSTQAGTLVLKSRAKRESLQPLELLHGLIDDFRSECQARPELAVEVRQRVGDQWDDVLRILPALVRQDSSAKSECTAGPAPTENESLSAVMTILTALGSREHPALVILDDCQWTHDLVHQLAVRWQFEADQHVDRPRHVQLVIAYRSEEVGPDNPLRRLAPQLHLEVGPLMPRDVRLLLESMAGPLPDAAVDVVIRLAQGSPFMAVAILNGLVESRALVFERNAWQVDALALESVRSSAHAAEFLSQRLTLLDPESLRLLQAGALLGIEFSLEMAVHLSGLSIVQAWNAVNLARRRQLLWWSRTDGSCQFVHDKIREALEESQRPEDRCRFHRRAADFLLRQAPDQHSQLAIHLHASEQFASALGFALRAAEAARSRHALDLAEQQYRIAEQCAARESTATHFTIAEGLGDVLMLKGRYAEAEQQFERAGQLAATAERQAEVCCRRGQLLIKRGDMHAALDQFQLGLESLGITVPRNGVSKLFGLIAVVLVQAVHTLFGRWLLHRVPRQPDVRECLTLRLYSGYSHASWYCSKLPLLMWAHLRGMNLGERFLPSLELAQIYSDHAPGMTLIPWHGRGQKYAQRSLAIRRQLGDVWGQGQSWHFYGIVQYAAGRYEECLDACRQAIQILQRTGDYWQVHIARYQVAASLYHLGDLRGALEEARRNHVSGVMLGDEQASGIILDVWARVAPGGVPEDLLQAELRRVRHDFQGAAQVQLAAGVQRLSQGQLDQSLLHLEQALAIVRESGVRNQYTTPIAAWMTTALRLQAESGRVLSGQVRRHWLRRAERMARRAWLESWWCRNDLPHVLRECALLAAIRGRMRKSRKLFDRSLALAERMGARHAYALTLKERARVGRECGWQDAEQQEAAARSQLAALMINDTAVDVSTNHEPQVSVSLMDRFETLLKTGRDVVASLTKETIRQCVAEAGRRLLRVGHAELILWDDPNFESANAPLWSVELLERLKQGGHLLTTFGGVGTSNDESSLYAPVSIRGQTAGCLFVVQRELPRAFGADEERIAEFLATLAGAALENAEGFARLEQMNTSLEHRVAERTRRLNERADLLISSYRDLEQTTDDLRRTQQELVASTRAAEAASRAKSRFLAAISHEIRTPMNGVIGMAELALSTQLNDRQRMYVTTINQSAKTLLALLNDILDFSKIEAGKLELEQRPLSLHETIHESVRLLSVSAAQKGLELHCHVHPAVPDRLIGDATRLRQIVLNLLGNAIKFTTAGRVSVQVELTPSGQMQISVSDTGIGIPSERLSRVFQAFDQGGAAVTRRYGGTGLGLAICRELVGLMGGEITVESQVDVGSCFRVNIPLTLDETSLDGGESEPLAAAPTQRVLVVSTSPAAVAGHRQWLHHWGFTTTVVTDANEAKLLLAGDHGCDLLLVDVATRNSGECRLLMEIEQAELLPPAGAVLLTLAGAEDCSDRSDEHTHSLLVLKPVTPHALRDHLRSRLQPHIKSITKSPDATDDNCPSLNVLVVDDSPINLDVAAGLLELMGQRVRTADGGKAALDELAREKFDLVLMDVDMPDLDGLATTRLWRRREQGRPATILAMSAHIADEVREHCLTAGMDGFLSKPVDPAEMRRALARVAQQIEADPQDAELLASSTSDAGQ